MSERSAVVAVVGGRGVIGAAVVRRLTALGHRVVVVTHDTTLAGVPGYRYGDMLRADTLPPALAGCDVVIQTATFPTYPIEKPGRRETFVEFDGAGTERLVEAAQAIGARRYVYISGSGTGRGSTKPYFQALWRGEQAVLRAPLEGVCIRPTLAYGPTDRSLNRALAAARRLPLVPVIGDGRQLHQPIFLDDLAEAVSRLAPPGAPAGTFEVGGPDRMTLDEMLQRAMRAAGVERPLLHVPPGPTRLAARVLERLPSPPLTAAAVDFMMEDFVADLDRLRATFDLALTPLDAGLRTYLTRH